MHVQSTLQAQAPHLEVQVVTVNGEFVAVTVVEEPALVKL